MKVREGVPPASAHAPEARLIDPISDGEWLAFVGNSPSAEIFHHPLWLDLLRSQYGYEIQACCIGNGDGIEAGIPIARIDSRLTGSRLVSVPFSDVCSPVLDRGRTRPRWSGSARRS